MEKKKITIQMVTHELEPYYNRDSRILILGSIPSVKSREYGFYYMHPQNKFWKVLTSVYEEELPDTIESKKAFLKRHHLALWDVIASCEIHGSSDSSIKKVVPNDINHLLRNSKIDIIFTTGKKAQALYEKYCYPSTGIPAIYLPSTSPANIGNYSFEMLKQEYNKIRSVELED